MPVQPGTKLGPYEVLALIGVGGMGEVYKASDTRLKRTVAVKVLLRNPSFSSETSEMKQRFEREAHTIAALSHPHICMLFDVGQQDGIDYLVMEYLEGETLDRRLDRGALESDEALKVAIEIAEALHNAHRNGVVHRDLKPSNVMLTKSGSKLLDFGLAKLKAAAPPTSLSALPTHADLTAQGTLLGTLQYMAPEQLEGKDVDARTDIFAFGAVLYEMLTGRKAFEGESQASLISAIMSAEPQPLLRLLPLTAPALDYVVRRCLAKDPDQRLQTALDLTAHLKWIAEGSTRIGQTELVASQPPKRKPLLRTLIALTTLLVIALSVAAFLYLSGPQEPLEVRFHVPVPAMTVEHQVTVSPNGRWIAFVASRSPNPSASNSSLFVRPIDSVEMQEIAGTVGATRPFWSPDSRSLAFFANGMLHRVDIEGGRPQVICAAPNGVSGTWNASGVIVFGSTNDGLQHVSANGGQPSQLTALVPSQQETAHGYPYFLPDGRHYLYLAWSTQAEGRTIYVGSLDAKDRTRLFAAQSKAVYAEPGFLLFHREGTLFAQPFDARRLTLTGEPVRIADRVSYGNDGAAGFDASENGELIYRAASDIGQTLRLTWVDRSGNVIEQLGEPGGYRGVDVSPDGKRLAVHRHDGEGGDVWVFESGRPVMSRLTFDPTQHNAMPIWSPDGRKIAFGSQRNGKWGIYAKLADGGRDEELLVESDVPKMPMSWSPSGESIVYWEQVGGGDQWMLPLTGDRKPLPILNTPFGEAFPQVSPDGKWMAYDSNETGNYEVYIKSFPEGAGRVSVSTNGGWFPRWRRDSKELYFMTRASAGKMMAAQITVTGSSIQPGVPRELFDSVHSTFAHQNYLPYAVSNDGQRFLITRPEAAQTMPTPITVVLNWTVPLRAK
ncbi:MAG TPA: protein kinase [Vicinamibacterales bacterium]|nr:protein kinase [Vicinamibacterales bacterium]